MVGKEYKAVKENGNTQCTITSKVCLSIVLSKCTWSMSTSGQQKPKQFVNVKKCVWAVGLIKAGVTC